MLNISSLLIILMCASAVHAAPAGRDLVIWDNKPAGNKWDIAYPVGNGRMGAMPFGNFPEEKILINEESIWSRSGKMAMPDNSFEHLEKVRELEAAGDYQGADRHFEKTLMDGRNPDGYQLVGWLQIVYQDAGELKETYRELDLKTGVARNVYTLADGGKITQKVFAGGADDVIAVTISATKKIGVRVSLDGGVIENGDIVKTASASRKPLTRRWRSATAKTTTATASSTRASSSHASARTATAQG